MKLKDIDGFLASILQGRGITTQYQVSFTNEALADIDEVEKNGMLMPILGALAKLAVNPLNKSQGGYGEPLGNKHGFNLTGCSAVKIKGRTSVRIVYKILPEIDSNLLKVIIIGVRREDDAIYRDAERRLLRLLSEIDKNKS